MSDDDRKRDESCHGAERRGGRLLFPCSFCKCICTCMQPRFHLMDTQKETKREREREREREGERAKRIQRSECAYLSPFNIDEGNSHALHFIVQACTLPPPELEHILRLASSSRTRRQERVHFRDNGGQIREAIAKSLEMLVVFRRDGRVRGGG